jgi:hypothetical protein
MNLSDNEQLGEDNGRLTEVLSLCRSHQRWLDELRHERSPPPSPLGHPLDEISRLPPLR